MEKDDVRILVNCYWIFGHYANSRLYLPVQKFPDILGIPWYRSRFVSNDHLIIILFINYIDLMRTHSSCCYFRQMDIGLEIYETKDLFVRLLTPTFFVIITVLQIHYFHNDFLEVTNIERLGLVKKIMSSHSILISNSIYTHKYFNQFQT